MSRITIVTEDDSESIIFICNDGASVALAIPGEAFATPSTLIAAILGSMLGVTVDVEQTSDGEARGYE